MLTMFVPSAPKHTMEGKLDVMLKLESEMTMIQTNSSVVPALTSLVLKCVPNTEPTSWNTSADTAAPSPSSSASEQLTSATRAMMTSKG